MDVNFLNNKKDTEKSVQPSKKSKEDKEKIEWSKPVKEPEVDLVKNKESSPPLEKTSKLSFLRGKDGLAKTNNGIDKNKLKRSRKEILRIIKEEDTTLAKVQNFSPPIAKINLADKNTQDNSGLKTNGNRLSKQTKKIAKNFNDIFKKISQIFSKAFNQWGRKNDKGLLADYQKVLQAEKKLKESAVKAKITPKPELPNKIDRPVIKLEPKIEIKPEPRPIKEVKESEEPKPEIEPIVESRETAKKNKEDEKSEDKQTVGVDWIAPDVLETNLIKGKAVIFFNWQKNIITLLIFSSILIAVLGVTYGGLSWWGKSQSKIGEVLTVKISELNQDIKKTEVNLGEVLVFKEKLGLVTTLLNQHTYWTNFFKFLEENTLSGVYYSDFSGDNKGVYTLTTNARDYDFIVAQVKSFLAHEKVIDASVEQAMISSSDIVGDLDKVNFELELTVDPSIFIK